MNDPADLREPLQKRLDLALAMAGEASHLILSYYQSSSLAVESKRDASPVTAADRGAEELIRARLAREFPDDAILGEEFGEKPGTSGYRWILDPVDGTKSFIHGVPLFGTLIGIERGTECVAGVCHFPAMNETVWGGRGLGAWWRTGNGMVHPARVSSVNRLTDATVCFTTVQGYARVGRFDVFESLVAQAHLLRGWGDCYGHILVATGRADVMVDPLMNPWDAAALVPIVTEAGGSFVDWMGQPSIWSGNGISINRGLADDILSITRGKAGPMPKSAR
ncbi:MAG TPA: histidinol-phosphatase [Planctomycetaceae bacterium]|nr:histidinol-phosphatase [Planctomycetaceae bacterium]